jgi:hypothetical protein
MHLDNTNDRMLDDDSQSSLGAGAQACALSTRRDLDVRARVGVHRADEERPREMVEVIEFEVIGCQCICSDTFSKGRGSRGGEVVRIDERRVEDVSAARQLARRGWVGNR